MTIEEIKSIEGARQEASTWNVVHFLKEANGFYRAHDWSAWLMKSFPLNDLIAGMSVTAKRQKDGYVDAFVGFPATSLSKYIPNADAYDFRAVSDNQFDIKIELPAEIGEVSFDNLNRLKEEWKATLQIQDGNRKQRREERELQEQAPRLTRMSDIVSRLVSLPMEDLSPKDAFDILRDLRRQAVALF